MNDHSTPKPPENTQSNASESSISQMPAEQQTQYIPSQTQSNPEFFAQVAHQFIQQHGSGAAPMLIPYLTQNSGPANSASIGDLAGAAPHAVNTSYLQLHQQPVSVSTANMNTPFGSNLAADFSRLNHASAIPPSRDFDVIVASRLRQADRDGKSYKNALREMHSVLNFPSNLWIDYYLDRRVTINELIDESEHSTPVRTAKKPVLNRTVSTTGSGSMHAARSSPASTKTEKGTSSELRASRLRQPTLNSMLTFYDATSDPKDDAIPDPPSHEPTPPTEVQTMGLRGNAFTDADVKYLVDFVSWVCANKDWSVTKMYKKLYKRAPHHSAASWAGKAKTIPIIAKIIDTSEQDEDEYEEEDENHQEMDVSDTADTEYSSSGRRRQIRANRVGIAVTDDDFEKMANWILENNDDWEEMSGRMRWFPFGEKHVKRSWKAWSEAYRRYQAEVDTLVEDKRRRAQASGPSGIKRPRFH